MAAPITVVTDALTDALIASTFLRLLRREIGAANYRRACRENAAETDSHVCHSHDYCDANMVMLAAMEQHGYEMPDMANDDQCAHWSRVWQLAFHAMCANQQEVR